MFPPADLTLASETEILAKYYRYPLLASKLPSAARFAVASSILIGNLFVDRK
jgi:hypothetical protein